MLLNTLKNEKLKKTLEAGFYWGFLGGFFNANSAYNQYLLIAF